MWNDPKLQPYYPHRNELSCSEGVVLRGERIIIPASLQERILDLAHQGHQGITKTKSRLRSKVWWPWMSSQADKFVRLCQSCFLASSTATQTTLLKPTPLPEAAWLLVGVDFVGLFPTGENLLVCIDYYSRYPDVEIMKTITTAALEPRLRRIFARYGIPKEIVTDNAQTFCSASFAHLMDAFGSSTGESPQTIQE